MLRVIFILIIEGSSCYRPWSFGTVDAKTRYGDRKSGANESPLARKTSATALGRRFPGKAMTCHARNVEAHDTTSIGI